MRPDPASGDSILVARADGTEERIVVPPAPGIHTHERAWSADGAWIYFDRGLGKNNEAPTEIWRVPSAGGRAEVVVGTQGVAQAPLATPDGRGLIYAGDQSGAPSTSGGARWAVAASAVSHAEPETTSRHGSRETARRLAAKRARARGCCGCWT